GGLMIFTSSPYALCHQLSNGADAAITKQPQMQTHAPSGPRNPQNCTPRSRSSWLPNVVRNTSHADVAPATIPASCSRTCGGDQNVSRPIDRCHEMSQIRPVTIAADAKSAAYSGAMGS